MIPYIKRKFKTVINITEVVTIHYYEFDASFVFEGEAHDFWEMVYVDSGMVEVTSDGKPLILKQGEIIFHKPNEFHTIRSYDSSPNIFVISFVCKSAAMRFFENYTDAVSKHLKPLLAGIIHEAENTYYIPKNDTSPIKLELKPTAKVGGEQLIQLYLEQFLITLLRDVSEKQEISFLPTKESVETQLVSQIKQFIRSKAAEKVKVEDICNTFGYSKSYLSLLFKEQTGYPLSQYHTRCQIEEAKKMIRQNRYNISQISDLLGFDNPQYFARVFKRVTALTPTEFRRSLAVDN